MKKNNETDFNWVEIIDISLTTSFLWKIEPKEITFNNITVNGVIINKPPTEFQLFEKVKELIKKTK